MVNDALIGTTEFDIFSLNPATCALNWRTREVYPPALLPANRGAAYLDGMLFRGTQDGRVVAYDFKTGKRIGEATIADPKRGEAVPAAPIAHDGVVYIGNSGGDFKGGKGKMYALDAKTGKISGSSSWCPGSKATWFADPWASRRSTRRRGKTRRAFRSAVAACGRPTRSIPRPACCTSPAAIRRLISRLACARATTFTPRSVVVLDAKTGDYKHHFKLVPKDWHDWDVSNSPILVQTMSGKQVMAVTPKDGHLYGFDLANNSRLYRVPVTRVENVAETFSPGQWVHFCPGSVGGAEWNSPSYVPQTNLILVGEVEWCVGQAEGSQRARGRETRSAVGGGRDLEPVLGIRPLRQGVGRLGSRRRCRHRCLEWRLRSNYPIVAGVTPTAGGVVFFGDMGGNFYALDSQPDRSSGGRISAARSAAA